MAEVNPFEIWKNAIRFLVVFIVANEPSFDLGNVGRHHVFARLHHLVTVLQPSNAWSVILDQVVVLGFGQKHGLQDLLLRIELEQTNLVAVRLYLPRMLWGSWGSFN